MPGRRMLLPAILLGICGLAARGGASAAASDVVVDVQLVLAADNSGSMSPRQRRIQRMGSAAAFRHRALQRAILSGPLGRVAVTYVEWSGLHRQRVVVPWRLLDSPAAMEAFATELAGAEMRRPGAHTSISGVLRFAGGLLAESSYQAWRRVIDVSGNGINEQGPPPADVLSDLDSGGSLVVNGLVFAASNDAGPFAAMLGRSPPNIGAYFRREVIAGPGAFVMEVREEGAFAEAMRRKLVWEITSARREP